jgi:murein DD-endopeptidase MepM/ murein hydrolase activator NlpD
LYFKYKISGFFIWKLKENIYIFAIGKTARKSFSGFGSKVKQNNKMMIKRISAGLVFTSVLLLFAGVSYSANNIIQKPDTLKLPDIYLNQDSSNIGPDVAVSEKSIMVNDEDLLRFSDLLSQFGIPVEGKVISRFGMRHGRMHTGTDIRLNLGDTVYAAFNGEVFRACRYYGYGNLVIIKHSHGLETYYGHLSKILVNPGDRIKKGEPLGLGGRTGRATCVHLHFEVREKRVAYNPELVYDFQNLKIRDDICDKEKMADLITNPKTGEYIHITRHGNPYVEEMGAIPAPVSEYIIKTGDSLWEIARKFNTSVGNLCEHNNLTTHSILKIGSVLKIRK